MQHCSPYVLLPIIVIIGILSAHPSSCFPFSLKLKFHLPIPRPATRYRYNCNFICPPLVLLHGIDIFVIYQPTPSPVPHYRYNCNFFLLTLRPATKLNLTFRLEQRCSGERGTAKLITCT